MVAAADVVVDGGEVQGVGRDCGHDVEELAAGADGVLAAGATDAGAGLRGVDVFVVAVEARRGLV